MRRNTLFRTLPPPVTKRPARSLVTGSESSRMKKGKQPPSPDAAGSVRQSLTQASPFKYGRSDVVSYRSGTGLMAFLPKRLS
jgi:hypothetical protein